MRWTHGLFALVLFFALGSARAADREPPSSRVTNSIGMAFVLIPAGTFKMGSPPEEKYRDEDEVLHEVTIARPFYLQTTEVTQRQWKAVMGDSPSSAQDCGDNCPVERISWQDCQNFIAKLNKKEKAKYRLPTEAEWEYGCRAGTATPYFWGRDIDCTRAMFGNNTFKGPDTCVAFVNKKSLATDSPAPVMTYPPNAWGLYDMNGNVWEWCQDWYGKYNVNDRNDPAGPSKGNMRVRRGGSFYKYGWYCRSANRNRGHPFSRYNTQGFRLVREVP